MSGVLLQLVVDQEEGLEEAEGDSPLEDADVIRDRCIVHLWMLLNLTFVTHKPYTFIFSIQHIGYACLLHIPAAYILPTTCICSVDCLQ